MKLRIALLLMVVSGLIASPVLAADRSYDNGGSVLIITSPSALNGCSVFYPWTPSEAVGDPDPTWGCEVGISPWANPANSTLVIDPDPNGNLGTDLPILRASNTNSRLTQEFSCASTSNLFSSAPDPVPGCVVFIEADTYNDSVPLGPLQATNIEENSDVFPGGYAVTFPPVNNDPYGGGVEAGQGIWCDAWCDPVANGGSCSAAEDELIEGGGADGDYCNRFLGYTEEQWQPAEKGGTAGDGLQFYFNPLTLPTWYFSKDFDRLSVPASTAALDYQIFNNNLLGDAVRGNLVQSTAFVAGGFEVPLAPLAALGALGTSLAFMGYSVIRRRK